MSDTAQSAPVASRLNDRLFLACGLAWGASVIHVEAAIEHLQEFALFSVFFALLAATQLLWGILLYRSPGRKLLIAGAVMSLAVVALWLVSRTSGLPIGPAPGTAERFGALDSVATGDEAVLAVLMFFQLRPVRTGLLARGFTALITVAGVGLVLFSSLFLTLAAHSH
ncbi:MAG: hypothetical protein QOK25_1974 [Thermoleophilaceae bacterium]|nr:hypothetical protein [Thermoleophilaceae bacterium]